MTVTLATPERSLEQRLTALREANRIRSARAVLKKRIARRQRSWTVALSDPDCDTMKVVDLLLVVPAIGRVKANTILRRCEISPSRSVGALTERQRLALLEHVGA